MKVLITGASGFIGSHLVEKLAEAEEVYSLERYSTGRYVLGEKYEVQKVYGDLRDYFVVRDIIGKVQPDVVFHLAAISPVAYSFDHPQEVTEVNYLGTVNLAEACLRLVPHFKQFLYAGTAEEYGSQTEFPIKEDAMLKPLSPYAVAKAAANHYLEYMLEAHHFPATILRGFNTYGRRDNPHFFMERTITQMLRGEKEIRLGDPTVVRDWLYVDDHVNGYLQAYENMDKAIGETFNLATGVGVTTKETATLITELVGFKGKIVWHTIPDRPSDPHKLVGDASKANKVLGWKAEVTLRNGLLRTIEFWRTKIEKKGS